MRKRFRISAQKSLDAAEMSFRLAIDSCILIGLASLGLIGLAVWHYAS